MGSGSIEKIVTNLFLAKITKNIGIAVGVVDLLLGKDYFDFKRIKQQSITPTSCEFLY